MILPNLCCTVRVTTEDEQSLFCISVVVPHPKYLREEEWMRVDDAMVDCHTVSLMRQYSYKLHMQGDVIMGVELACQEKNVDYIKDVLNSVVIQ